MAEYEDDLPAFHLTLDEFEELTDVLSKDIDFSDPRLGEFAIKITEGKLSKTYNSVDKIREDYTLSDNLRDVSVTVRDESSQVRMYWDSTGSYATSKVRIRGDETLVKTKSDDLRRFFENYQNRWRTLIGSYTSQIVVALLFSIVSGIILHSTILQETQAFVSGVLSFNILLVLQFGMNRIYPKNLLTFRPESRRVNYLKRLLQIAITMIAFIGGIITISEFLI